MMHATLALAATAAATTPGGPEPAEAAPCNVSGLWTWGIFEHANEFVVTSTSPERSLFNFTSTNPTPWHTATGVVYSNRTVVLDYGCAAPGCSSVAGIYANCSTIVQAGSGPAAARSFVRGSRPTPPKPTQQTTLGVDADLTVSSVSPWMGRGAGLEDANHEITGGLWSQMLWGESFEEPANADGVSSRGTDPSPGGDITWVASRQPATSHTDRAVCTWSVAAGDAQTGVQSQQVSGAGCGVMNRGADAMGLAFEPSREYNGFVFVRLPDGERESHEPEATAELEFSLQRIAQNATKEIVTRTRVAVPVGTMGAWTMVNFTLHTGPNASVGCFEDAHPVSPCDTDVAEKECYSCSGAFVITVLTPDLTVRLDMAYLAPGSWGQYGRLPVRRDIAELYTQTLNYTVQRFGGSMVNANEYRWKRFRGPFYQRPPYSGEWYGRGAEVQSPGWRLFEFLEFCEATRMKAVVTLNSRESAADMAE